MTDEDKALVNEARLDAKSFRENTIYTMDGVPARLIANADRLDQYADRIEALSAENERLREALRSAIRNIENLTADIKGHTECDECQQNVAMYEHAVEEYREALGETK